MSQNLVNFELPAHRDVRQDGRGGPRVLMYSHDTFGLGHIRRTRSIANAIVAACPGASILIISGSPLAGSFNFGDGIDFVHIPSVAKSNNGSYSSASLHIDFKEIVALRQSIIHETARLFRPDIFIADKEPNGFHGELLPTIEMLSRMGTRLVVGIRDVLDEPEVVRSEWEARGAIQSVIELYDDVFVYGLKEFYEPLQGIALPADVARRITYTGYLKRSVPGGPSMVRYPKLTKNPFILVTTGGGGDGAGLIELVISAYEQDRTIPLPAVLVFGPFLSRTQRNLFSARIDRLANVEAIAFDPMIERLMNRAAAIVAMGGYNTFCEILSFDKPALIVPRTMPRMEQAIRSRRAVELGLVRELLETGNKERDTLQMAQELKNLAGGNTPSVMAPFNMLEGLTQITASLAPSLARSGPSTIRQQRDTNA